MDFISAGCGILDYRNSISVDNSDIIFCPNCGAINHISLYPYGSIQGLIFCVECGKEI